MQKLVRVIAILGVILIAAFLRHRAVQLLPVDYDEPIYLKAGQHYAAAILDRNWGEIIRYDYTLEHPPLVKLAYGITLSFLPQIQEIPAKPVNTPPPQYLPDPQFRAARYTSMLFGILEAAVLAVLNPFAGLMLAIHTFTIKYTSQVMLEALPALSSLMMVVLFRRWERNRDKGAGTWHWLVISGSFLGITAASKYLYAVVGIAVVLYWLWITWKRKEPFLSGVRVIALWGMIAIFTFWLFDPFLWTDPITHLKESVLYNVSYSQGEHVESAGFPAWQAFVWLLQSVPWHPGVFIISLDALVALFSLFGLRNLWKKEPIYIFWLAVGFAFLWIWTTKWPQYILMVTAPVSYAAGEGIRAVIIDPLQKRVRMGMKIPSFRRVFKTLVVNIQQAFTGKDILIKAAVWLLPGTIILAAITFYPMVYQFAMSLTDFSTVSIRDGLSGGVWREAWLGITGQVEPVGIELFSARAAGSGQVQYVGPVVFKELLMGGASDILVFEGIWTLLAVGLQTGFGLIVALMLNRGGIRYKGFWRTLFILPWAIPEFVVALIWSQIFDPKFGWFNLATLPWSQRPDYPGALQFSTLWQNNPNAGLAVLLLIAVWYGFPFMMLASTAGLKMIPRDVYDAASIDGANRWQQFKEITLPLLRPLLVPAIIIRTIFTFNQFYLFYVLMLPYPLTTFANTSFFFFGELGQYAVSAVFNIFTMFVLVLLILWFNRWSKAFEGVTYA